MKNYIPPPIYLHDLRGMIFLTSEAIARRICHLRDVFRPTVTCGMPGSEEPAMGVNNNKIPFDSEHHGETGARKYLAGAASEDWYLAGGSQRRLAGRHKPWRHRNR